MDLNQIYRQHETEKKRQYASRVLEVEQATFTPLVFSTTEEWRQNVSVTTVGLLSYLLQRRGKLKLRYYHVLRTGGSVGEHRAVTWEVLSSTPTGPTLRVLK